MTAILFPVSFGCFGPSGPISLVNWRSDLLIIPGNSGLLNGVLYTYFVWMPYTVYIYILNIMLLEIIHKK